MISVPLISLFFQVLTGGYTFSVYVDYSFSFKSKCTLFISILIYIIGVIGVIGNVCIELSVDVGVHVMFEESVHGVHESAEVFV